MKLFGGSKNGKHTGGSSHTEPTRQDLDLTAGFAAVEDPQPIPEPPAPAPVPEAVPAPVETQPQEPVQPPAAPVHGMIMDREQEDGFINSIVEAVGLAEQEAAQPEKPKKEPKKQPKQTPPQPPQTPPAMPEEPKRPGKGKKAAIIAASVVGVLVLIALAMLFVMKLWISAPELGDNDTLTTPTPTAQVEDPATTPAPSQTGTSDRKEGCFTFAVVGADVASGNTDTIMVGRLDTVNGTLNVISIPRDTLINYGTSKINAAYAIGENQEKGKGPENLLKELKKLVGFKIDSYAVVNTKAVADLVNAIGGVEYNVPVDMIYDDPYQDLHIDIKAGLQKLSGEDAVKVLRYRHGYADGDIGRINVQQDFLMSLAKQMLSLGNIPNLNKVIQVYVDNVTTNLSASNVVFYATEFLKLKPENIQFMTLPGNTNGSINGISYVFIDVDAWLDMVNEYLNPFHTQVTSANVSIKTSTNGSSFTYTEGA